jgi:hypothetical protein
MTEKSHRTVMLLFLSFLCHSDFVNRTARICKDDDREWGETSRAAEEVCHEDASNWSSATVAQNHLLS